MNMRPGLFSLRGLLALFAVALARVAFAAQDQPPDNPEGRTLMQAAQRAVAAYHAGQPPGGSALRVVYFHPHDREPLPDYAERLDRVMTDISAFYRDGMRRFGLESAGLPLERENGHLKLHLVRGQHPASHYKYESGDETAAEVRAALKGTINLDREHVLILYALCHTEPDGRRVFNAPYYGATDCSQQWGLCHAADCDLLDVALLTETKRKIVYTEHYYARREQTYARFNTAYLGGIAHELGHGLGLPHDAGAAGEERFGTSLMGAGNHTYRQEVWGGGKPTVLSRSSALQLLSHPLFTGSNHGRSTEPGAAFAALTFSADGRTLRLHGRAGGLVAAYAVIAYVWPASSKTNHGARSFPVVLDGSAFSLPLTGLKPDRYRMQLTSLHVNGAHSRWNLEFDFDATGVPRVAALQEAWNAEWVTRAESAVARGSRTAPSFFSDEMIAQAPSTEARKKLTVLRAVVHPPAPFDVATVAGNSASLSDAKWTEAKVGWGQPARNHTWFDDKIQNGVFLNLRGEFFSQGLYAHSPSRYTFALAGKWSEFSAAVGLRDGAHPQGSARFIVLGDGRELFRSRALRVGEREAVKADVTGVTELALIAEGTEGHNHNSWAIWAAPTVQR